MPTKLRDVVFGIVMLVIAGLLWLETMTPQFKGNPQLDYGFPPSFYPRILLGIWAVLAVVILLRGLVKSAGVVARPHLGHLALAVVVSFAYYGLIGAVGFLLATIPFTFAFILLLGYRRAVVLVPVAIIFPIAIWWVMTGPMQIVLPQSPWFASF